MASLREAIKCLTVWVGSQAVDEADKVEVPPNIFQNLNRYDSGSNVPTQPQRSRSYEMQESIAATPEVFTVLACLNPAGPDRVLIFSVSCRGIIQPVTSRRRAVM